MTTTRLATILIALYRRKLAIVQAAHERALKRAARQIKEYAA
jgi:hypothetical protein